MAMMLQVTERERIHRAVAGVEPEGTAFDVARELCLLVNRARTQEGPFPSDVQEILIRARERRERFGAAAPILDGLIRERGLFPYLQEDALGVEDRLAYEAHRPRELGGGTIFHHPQARILHLLLMGENVALSAPTSFGKSLIVDAVIAEGGHDQLAIIVPTIALIDETRRRLQRRFGTKYKIVTHPGQAVADRNLFVLTPERVPAVEGIEAVSFFAIDEFYKLDPALDPERHEALNEALYRLRRTGAQFYLLGPHIETLPVQFTEGYRCRFERTDYATVATEVHRVHVAAEQRLETLLGIVQGCVERGEPTLVYCSSPESARITGRLIAEHIGSTGSSRVTKAAEWVGDVYHHEWSVVAALAGGVGVHHGRLPRALQQFVTRAFNDGDLAVLVCTSTLIEGVNTTAKNVIVFDHSIGGRPLDVFTFHNIKGRSGRMMRHFVGKVYVFSEPPQGGDLVVDVPVATQSESASNGLLIQLDDGDLSSDAKARVAEYYDQDILPLAILRANHGIDPTRQLALAEFIRDNAEKLWSELNWYGPRPSRAHLFGTARLIWRFFLDGTRVPRGVVSAEQLAFFVGRFADLRDVTAVIRDELAREALRDEPRGVDAVVEGTLEFLRNWSSYHFPRMLMALSRIQAVVLEDAGLPPGDYSVFARALENDFLPAGVAALDEYGIPSQVGMKLLAAFPEPESIDAVVEALRAARRSWVSEAGRPSGLTGFEWSLVEDALECL